MASLKKINENSAAIFEDKSYTEGVLQLRKTYADQTTQVIPANNNKGYQIASPSGPIKVDPIYSHQLKNKDDQNTMIYQLNKEEQLVFGGSEDALEEMAKTTKTIHTQITPINDVLTQAENKIKDFDSLITGYSNKFGARVVSIQDISSKSILLVFNNIVGFCIVSSVLVLVFLVISAFSKKKCLKFFTHILWNIVLIFSGLCFMIGGILGSASIATSDMIPVVNYLFSKEFLTSPESIFDDLGDVPTYLDICLNGNGDLSQAMGLEVSKDSTKVLNDVYTASVQIKHLKESLAMLGTDSPAITLILNQISDWENSIRSTFSPDVYAPEIQSAETSMKACGKDYHFVIPEETCDSLPGVTCEQINKDRQPHSGCTSAETILFLIKNSVVQNQEKLNDAKLLLANAHADYKKLLVNIKGKVTETGEMTDILLKTLNSFIGEKNTITDILNCGFFKHDLIIFLDQFGVKFSNDSYFIAFTCLGCSICSFLGVLLFISAINYLTQRRKKTDVVFSEMSGQLQQQQLLPTTTPLLY